MKIMTYNVQHCKNYLEQKIDYELIAKIISESGADVVGLNEMFSDGEESKFPDQTKVLAELAGYEHSYFAEAIKLRGGSPYGNAMLSKIPIESVQTVIIPDPDPHAYNGYYETRCLLKARLKNGLTVIVVHVGLNPDEQENAIKTVLSELENEKCILMGDFNIKPDNTLLTPIRERMRDAAELFSEPLLSFPSDKPKMKIDYVFVSRDIEIISADIPAIVGADHRPHTAQIKF